MSILHTINKSPFQNSSFESCLGHVADGDAVLLIEDGVYAAIADTVPGKQIKAKKGKVSFYVLGPDIAARGLNNGSLADGIEVVDYGGFVDLVTKHEVAQAWL